MGKPPGHGFRRSITLGVAAIVVVIVLALTLHRPDDLRISEFGRYAGFTEADIRRQPPHVGLSDADRRHADSPTT